MLADPLMRREMSGMARRWTTFAARMAAGLGMAWAVWELWGAVERRSQYAGSLLGMSDLAGMGRQVFVIYLAGLLVGLPSVAVMAAADLVPKEVRNGTLGLLFLTPLTPWRIVTGKWKAAMAHVVLLLLAGGPLAAICVYLGGVGPVDLLWSTLLPLAAGAFAAALTLLVSTLFRTAAVTFIVSVVLLLLGVFLPALAVNHDRTGFELLVRAHPVFAAYVCAEPRLARGTGLGEEAWMSATAVAGLLTLGLLALGAVRLTGRLQVQPGPGLLARVMRRLDGFYESINVGRVRLFLRSEGVWESKALIWKELRTRAAGRLRHATRLAVALLILAAVPLTAGFDGSMEAYAVFLGLMQGLLALQAVVAGVSLFAGEKDGRQWDILLSTPVTVPQILGSKLAGGLVTLAPTAVVFLLVVGALQLVLTKGAWFGVHAAVPAVVFVLFAYVVGAGASLRCATHRGAFGLAMGVVLGVLAGIPLLLEILHDLHLLRLEWETRLFLESLHPVHYLDSAARHLRWGGDGRAYYERYGDPLTSLSVYVALHAGATGVALVWMLQRFNRLTGRVG